jgi:ADP-ribose pyrophosphatase YjhB (NUDIX family)
MVGREVEGRLRLTCPDCGYVAYDQLKTCAGALIQREGKILLLRRGADEAFPGKWNLPAGYCEADEAPAVTAAREAAEETGLTVKIGPLVDVYYFDDDDRGNGVLILYEAEITGGSLRVDGREATRWGFFGPEELPQPLCGGGHDQAIEDWRQRALDPWRANSPMRYCPHCAHELEEREAFGRLRATCPRCGYVHFHGPKVGVSLLIERNGQALLVQRAVDPGDGLWSLPSGFVDWDESPEEAALREAQEETGLGIELVELMDTDYYTEDPRGAGINLTYRARIVGGELAAADDARAVRFISPHELPHPEAIAFPGHWRTLERWAAGMGETP